MRWPDVTFLGISDGIKMAVEYCGHIDVVMHCPEEFAVIYRDVAFVPGVPFDVCSFNLIHKENVLSRLTAHAPTYLTGVCFAVKRRSVTTSSPSW